MWSINETEPQQCDVWAIVEWLEEHERVSLDIETTGLNYLKDEVVVISIGDRDTQFVISTATTSEDDIRIILTDLCSKTVCGHNLMFDYEFLQYRYGIKTGCIRTLDTFAVETTLRKGEKASRSLNTLTEKYLDITLDKSLQTTFTNSTLRTEQIMYAADDVKYIDRVLEQQEIVKQTYIQQGLGTDFLYELDNRIVAVMPEVTTKGINYDVELHNENTATYKAEEEATYKKIQTFLARNYEAYNLNVPKYSKDFEVRRQADLKLLNLHSPTQVTKLLQQFDPTIKNTSARTLEKYLISGQNNDAKTLISLILKNKEYSKLVSTYGDSFLSTVVDGRIRTHISLNETTTGRFTSSDVKTEGKKKLKVFSNLQNIPSKPEIKRCYKPDEGYSMGCLDLKGAELTILADFSQCPKLLEAVSGDLDLHSAMATISYRIRNNDPDLIVSSTINKELRSRHKRVLFGLIYGAGPARIMELLGCTLSVAKRIYAALTEYLEVAMKYLNNYTIQSLKDGVAIGNNTTRRFIFLKEYTDYIANGIEHPQRHRFVRQLFNNQMQTTNADMLKSCIVSLYDLFNTTLADYNCSILFTVYDEIVYQFPECEPWILDVVSSTVTETCNKFLTTSTMQCDNRITKYWEK